MPMPHPDYADVRQFRFKLPDPLFPYTGKASIAAATLGELAGDISGWLAIHELSEHFTQNFPNRNPLNIPGPIYGAETDTCLTGPAEAPGNVLVDKQGQEFVFKQASSAEGFRDLFSAAICECFQGYGSDGDQHWRLSSIRESWRGRNDLIGQVGEEWCSADAIAAWRAALEGGAEDYLRRYAFFVENGKVAGSKDQLPDLA